MATTSSSISLIVLLVYVASAFSKETAEVSQRQVDSMTHHQAQKRSALIDPVESGYVSDENQDGGSLFDSPYDDLSKRNTLFRFGKRGSLFRFGKRGGSLFRFGKRGGTLFRFGRSGPQQRSAEATKRNSLFRFGKRADDSQLLETLQSYYGLPSYPQIDDVDSKRNVNSFHWGDSEK